MDKSIEDIKKDTSLIEIMDEAARYDFAVPKKWIQKLNIQKGFFKTLRTDLGIYSIALKRVRSSLEFFEQEYKVSNKRFSIFDQPVSYRIKNCISIFEKMLRNQNVSQLEPLFYRSFNDIGGTRITVNYIDNAYEVMNFISSSNDYKMIEFSDNIKNPREGGYRGLHIIVEVPNEKKDFIPKVEIQIRTSYQNSWSVKTHQLTYKRKDLILEFQEDLKNYSDILYEADEKCQEIRKKIERRLNTNEGIGND